MSTRISKPLAATAAALLCISCDGGPTEDSGTGTVSVSIDSYGDYLDVDHYQLFVDEGQSFPVDVNSVVRIPNLAAGTHQVFLAGVPKRCTVRYQGHFRSISVRKSDTTMVSFEVDCMPVTCGYWDYCFKASDIPAAAVSPPGLRPTAVKAGWLTTRKAAAMLSPIYVRLRPPRRADTLLSAIRVDWLQTPA